MQRNEQNKFMSITTLNQTDAFTIVELLIALTVISLILVISPTVWTNLNHQPQTERYSVQQFFHAITDEIQTNRLAEQAHDKLVLSNLANEQIVISKYQDLIRRQVNRTGHEILLRDVKQFLVYYSDDYVEVMITMNSGEVYEKTITIFVQK
ncbi:competence type IV pilus minor pilin ComGF [Amphibacillus xylanus]|nr:ComGF family competence protein [Amphibacillus xylanus]